MIDLSTIQLALQLTLNVQNNDPCQISPVTITFNEEEYQPYPLTSQGGQILQVVEGTGGGQRFMVIIKSDEGNVLSFLQKPSPNVLSNQWQSQPWLRGQLQGTVQALQSDNNFQLVRPDICSLPVFNPNMYETY